MSSKNSEKYVTCKICGVECLKNSAFQIYCTGCYPKSSYIPVVNKKRTCDNCKLDYVPPNKKIKFCSNSCKIQMRNKEVNRSWVKGVRG